MLKWIEEAKSALSVTEQALVREPTACQVVLERLFERLLAESDEGETQDAALAQIDHLEKEVATGSLSVILGGKKLSDCRKAVEFACTGDDEDESVEAVA